jgi:hypothetical protein
MIHTDSSLLPFIRIKIPLAPNYNDDKIRLCETQGELNLQLFSGEREAVAESDVGILKSTGERLIARVVFRYKYNSVKNEIEIYNNNFESDKSTGFTLTTQSGKVLGEFRACHEYKDFLKAGNNAGFTLHKDHFQALRNSLRRIHRTAEGSFLENRVGVLVHNQFPKELENKRAVYRNGVLSHVFDPEHDDESLFLDKYCTTAPLKSAVPGTSRLWVTGTPFLNVEGSGSPIPNARRGSDEPYWSGPFTNPYIYRNISRNTSWLNVWRLVVNRNLNPQGGLFCSSAGFGHKCTTTERKYLGAHVFKISCFRSFFHSCFRSCFPTQLIKSGENGVVHIIPACYCLNNRHKDLFQITPAAGVRAVILNDYHN